MISTQSEAIRSRAAGVPFVARPPSGGRSATSPTVVAWHMMDPPRTETAFAAALPLEGLDAWRIYLGLPLSGERLPAGGAEELMRLGYEDAVLNIHGPVSHQALEEFGPAFSELRARLHIGSGPVGVMGGSIGAAVAQLAMAEGPIEISAAVLVSPVVQLRRAVEAMQRRFGFRYEWSDGSRDVARRLDFVARADEIAQPGDPAVLSVLGAEDDREFHDAATDLRGALAARYDDPARAGVEVVAGMGHELADEPGTEPGPQTAHARAVDGLAASWFAQHLR